MIATIPSTQPVPVRTIPVLSSGQRRATIGPMRGLVLSDLHLLARRSRAGRHWPAIAAAIADTDVLVLNGDIFDFHWSSLGAPEAGLAFAGDWLDALLRRHEGLQVHYVTGNHDCQRPFIAVLDQVASTHGSFAWHDEHLQLGDCVFLHGDLHLSGQRFRREELPHGQGPLKQRCYGALHHARLHCVIAPLHGPRRCARRIHRSLRMRGVDLHRVRHVYFGHTHRAFSGFRLDGIAFHNTGAAVAGTRFRALRFRLGTDDVAAAAGAPMADLSAV